MGVPTRKIYSKIRGPANAVVLLGAGASAHVGGPLVRGFIDLAQDGIRHGEFFENEIEDIEKSLDFYNSLKNSFSLTEEDIDNVENLLAFADLSPIVLTNKIKKLFPPNIDKRMRNFVTTILKKKCSIAFYKISRLGGIR